MKGKDLNKVSFNEDLGKMPPQAVDFEEVVLGAILLESDCLVDVSTLDYRHFYKESNANIFKAIKELQKENKKIDIITVTQQLKAMDLLDFVGGAFYVSSLISRVASSSNIEYHASIIIEKFMLREIIKNSSINIKDAFSETKDCFDLIDDIQKQTENLLNSNIPAVQKQVCDVTEQSIKDLFTRIENRKGFQGIDTGFPELNKYIFGFQPNLYVFGARSSTGKTALALDFAKTSAKQGKITKIYSLETQDTKLVDRLILSETEVEPYKYRSGYISQEEVNEIVNAKYTIDELPIFINDKSGLSIEAICQDAKKTKKTTGLDFIIIDHLDLVRCREKLNKIQSLGYVTEELVKLYKELKIPILLLHQLSREVENRQVKDKRPILSDLRNSGDIEQNADVVILGYRPAKYYSYKEIEEGIYDDNGEDISDLMELIIAKNRDGECRTVKIKTNKSINKFFPYEPTYRSQTFEPVKQPDANSDTPF